MRNQLFAVFSTDNYLLIKNLHLTISVICIIPIALIYGVNPAFTLSKLFNIKVETINLTSIFRAIMALYLGLAATWIAGICKPDFWSFATLTNIIFMGSLALGRLLSIALDGSPSKYFLIGLVLELAIAFWGIRNLKQYASN